MPCFPALAGLNLSDSEVTFIKFIGYLLPLVWLAYLGKELFCSHRADPSLAQLTQSVMSLASSVATLTCQTTGNGERINELREMQIRDTTAVFRKIEGLDASFQVALRQHDRELGKLEGSKKP